MGKILHGEGEKVYFISSISSWLGFIFDPVTISLDPALWYSSLLPVFRFLKASFQVSCFKWFLSTLAYPRCPDFVGSLRPPSGGLLLELPSVKPSVFAIYYTGTQTYLKQRKWLYLGINENIFFGKSFNVCWKTLTQVVVNPWEVIQNGGGLFWSMHSFESRREFV